MGFYAAFPGRWLKVWTVCRAVFVDSDSNFRDALFTNPCFSAAQIFPPFTLSGPGLRLKSELRDLTLGNISYVTRGSDHERIAEFETQITLKNVV